MLGGLIAALVIAAVLIAVTPLQGMISQRLANGASDRRRGSLAVTATQTLWRPRWSATATPGTSRAASSPSSVGRSAKCPTCGNGTIGGNGQLWLLLHLRWLPGRRAVRRLLRLRLSGGTGEIRRPTGWPGVLALLLTFVFMFAYTATGAPLGFTMLAYAMLWRNARARRQQAAAAEPELAGQPCHTARPGRPGVMTAATPPDAQTWPVSRRPDSGRPGPRLAGVARGGALNLAGALVAAVTTLVLTVVITRQFSKPVAGAFFTAISLFLIVEAAAGLGAYVGLVNFIARLRRLGHEDPDLRPSCVRPSSRS